MTQQKSDTEEFQAWLLTRMPESDLKPAEVAEFTRWLMTHSCDHSEEQHQNHSVKFTEVLELVGWLGGRMKDMFVHQPERDEFSDWLKGRLSSHSCLSDDEMRKIMDHFEKR